MAEGDDRSEGRAGSPPIGVDPIGEALRATYDADNHESLGADLTGLMLELARIDPAVAPPVRAPAPPTWRQRLFGLRGS